MDKKANDILGVLNELKKNMTKAAEQGAPDGHKGPETGNQSAATTGSHEAEISTAMKNTSTHKTMDEESEIHSVPGAGEDTATFSIGGISSAPTGEEVPSTKATKDDPGTTAPARVGGEKYATASEKIAASKSILAEIQSLFNAEPVQKKVAQDNQSKEQNTCTDTADSETKDEGKAEVTVDEETQTKEAAEKLARDNWEEVLGYILGNTVSGQVKEANSKRTVTDEDLVKLAAADLQSAVMSADESAITAVSFLVGMRDQQSKQAMDMGADPAMMGAVDPAAMGGDEEIDPALLEALIASLGEGGEDPMAGGEDELDDASLEALIAALEGGEAEQEGDAVDDAVAAAAAVPGTDDETAGAELEAAGVEDGLESKLASLNEDSILKLAAALKKRASQISTKSNKNTNKTEKK